MPYHLFETAFGNCAIAWSEAGLTRLQLPELTRAQTEAQMRRADIEPSGMPLPDFVDAALTALQSYFAGQDASLEALRLDDSFVPRFHASVYQVLRRVARGTTVTYGDLAKQVGQPGAARAVGVAMSRNPWPVIVPCHRVLARGEQIGGFSAPGGTATKERLLALEGVEVGGPLLPGLFDPKDSQ